MRRFISKPTAMFWKQLNAYFEFYNLKRPHSSLDKMTPDEFYYDQLPQQNKVA
jgi:transposase InsO family protein